MSLLAGKRFLVTGVISDRSIAYGVAHALHAHGAELAFTYQNEKVGERVVELVSHFNPVGCFCCDVAHDEAIATTFKQLRQHWEHLDGFIHSIAFAPREALDGDFTQVTTRDNFNQAHEISSYSFLALTQAARSMLTPNASLITLSYLGSQRVVPNYNVMGLAKASLEANVRYQASALGPQGIRVNAISAGPIKTLAASGIKDLRKMLSQNEASTPLRRNVSIHDVGNTAAFLASEMSSGITGQVIYVDAGASINC